MPFQVGDLFLSLGELFLLFGDLLIALGYLLAELLNLTLLPTDLPLQLFPTWRARVRMPTRPCLSVAGAPSGSRIHPPYVKPSAEICPGKSTGGTGGPELLPLVFDPKDGTPVKGGLGCHPLYPAVDHKDPGNPHGGYQMICYALNDLKGHMPTECFEALRKTAPWNELMDRWRRQTELDRHDREAFKALIRPNAVQKKKRVKRLDIRTRLSGQHIPSEGGRADSTLNAPATRKTVHHVDQAN